jgi:hypothetical protein
MKKVRVHEVDLDFANAREHEGSDLEKWCDCFGTSASKLAKSSSSCFLNICGHRHNVNGDEALTDKQSYGFV